ncbi:maleylpyruvate isomerase family mycothiol-dependent enzyme [Actinokineospora sp.]|uniref:maleylpyruvate isomerase family mycothiol-dependent enzyme n=1 Tax=Actinokineospora sp. TaxID=1872133 RepID=UPI003D6B5F42
MTTMTKTAPRRPALDRPTAARLAETEYQRFVDVLRTLTPDEWATPTECPGWDVRAMAGHALGMAEMAASPLESARQQRAARKRGGVLIDALTALQVEEQAHLSAAEVVTRFAAVAPKAARARRRVPSLLRRAAVSSGTEHAEKWTVAYVMDVILTRDPWMHRMDIHRAVGSTPVLTAEHDGVLVADVVEEWAGRYGQPFTLLLSGPAGGEWTRGGPELRLDAIQFCRILSGRAPGDGLLAVQVPF